jgi:hypothetical protein
MDLRRRLEDGINVALHPEKATAEKSGVFDALEFYYYASVIPMIAGAAAVVLLGAAAFGFSYFFFSSMPFYSILAGAGILVFVLALLALFVAYMWILVPLSFFVNAAIFQFFGRYVFRQFKRGYSRTYSAVVYGSMPQTLLVFLLVVPFVNLIVWLWGFVVLVVALSNQQKITKIRAFAVVIGSAVLVALAIFISVHLLHPLRLH